MTTAGGSDIAVRCLGDAVTRGLGDEELRCLDPLVPLAPIRVGPRPAGGDGAGLPQVGEGFGRLLADRIVGERQGIALHLLRTQIWVTTERHILQGWFGFAVMPLKSPGQSVNCLSRLRCPVGFADELTAATRATTPRAAYPRHWGQTAARRSVFKQSRLSAI